MNKTTRSKHSTPDALIKNMSAEECRRELNRPVNYLTLRSIANRLLELAEQKTAAIN